MGMGDEILVVERDILFKDFYFSGFVTKEQMNYIPIILGKNEFQVRTPELEANPAYQQIISYIWIINPKTKQVFAYKRAGKKEHYNEGRLMNKVSCGVGGHIDKEDAGWEVIEKVMMRELKEEVKMNHYPNPKVVGFINDDSNPVGEVHFGVVAIVETTEPVEKGDNEMVSGNFYSTGHLYTIGELERMFNDTNNEVEGWTRISWPFIKDYLSKL
ncbi:hypothetical protein FJZ21_01415 [Candidatus Pacearchaeota archaeon]|nr:hypothetical protein [Candidatus Pacearchaeota archaeon]